MELKPITVGSLILQNQIVRSATLEGTADIKGNHGNETLAMYRPLAQSGVGAIITGFMAVNPKGRAMQPGQGCLYTDEHEQHLNHIISQLKTYKTAVIVQLAHCGRQTSSLATGLPVLSAGNKRSPYFKSRPIPLSHNQILQIIRDFGDAAERAKRAGAGGVQIHAAHGYLIHQFLSPRINKRKDQWGIDPATGMRTLFLQKIIDVIRAKCGKDFGVWIKVSHQADHKDFKGISFTSLIEFLDKQDIDLIEISYGTMENPLHIFRGSSIPEKAILQHNPRYKKKHAWMRALFSRFLAPALKLAIPVKSSAYNLKAAQKALQLTTKPIMMVGGIDSEQTISDVLHTGVSLAGMCRPFIADPLLVRKLNQSWKTDCIYCNLCAVYCDTEKITKCFYRSKK